MRGKVFGVWDVRILVSVFLSLSVFVVYDVRPAYALAPTTLVKVADQVLKRGSQEETLVGALITKDGIRFADGTAYHFATESFWSRLTDSEVRAFEQALGAKEPVPGMPGWFKVVLAGSLIASGADLIVDLINAINSGLPVDRYTMDPSGSSMVFPTSAQWSRAQSLASGLGYSVHVVSGSLMSSSVNRSVYVVPSGSALQKVVIPYSDGSSAWLGWIWSGNPSRVIRVNADGTWTDTYPVDLTTISGGVYGKEFFTAYTSNIAISDVDRWWYSDSAPYFNVSGSISGVSQVDSGTLTPGADTTVYVPLEVSNPSETVREYADEIEHGTIEIPQPSPVPKPNPPETPWPDPWEKPSPWPEPPDQQKPWPDNLPQPTPQPSQQPEQGPMPETDAATETTLRRLEREVVDFFDLSKPIDWEPMRRLGVSVTERFPFSLPWDILRAVSSMDVPEKLPGLEGDFYNPVSHSPLHWVIQWPTWVEGMRNIVRPALLVFFDVGLVYAVAKLFGGAR